MKQKKTLFAPKTPNFSQVWVIWARGPILKKKNMKKAQKRSKFDHERSKKKWLEWSNTYVYWSRVLPRCRTKKSHTLMPAYVREKNDECSSNWANKFHQYNTLISKASKNNPFANTSASNPFPFPHPYCCSTTPFIFPYFFLCEWRVLLKFVQYVNHLICNNFLLSPLLVLLIIEVEWAIEQDHIKDIENFFFVFLFMGFWFPMGVAWLSAVLFGDFLGVWNNGQKFWISRAFSWINFMWIQVQENFQISCEYKCRKIFKKRGKLKFSRYIYKMND
jgi:hypothetical protein